MKDFYIITIIILLFTFFGLVYTFNNKLGSKIVVQNQISQLLSSSEPVLGLFGEIIVRNNTWNVEIANNEESRVQGLSNRKTLNHSEGMLFVFDNMTFQYFWMKDMLIPIDMIFFDEQWKIVLIESNISPATFPATFGGQILSKYVLEVNALESKVTNLQVGDQAIFLTK